ncbi:MAG: helix-turn-helix domain-containing protein [Gammaproteobacteria bacterium]|nr:helix-turn-helix domain-containing protein [Gammaproteobacteria bacterium]MDD9894713.1 helix-turn-helix domain-containing protein [Gammaproteobacteria bacterium]MDD9957387.1 helix-turn-helix domain-containing protein [Gammaproteobacteria bacterium]
MGIAYATKMLHSYPVNDSDDQLNRFYRAIGDTTRRRVIDELALRDRQSLFEIYARVLNQHGINHSRQAFSRHLRVLEEAGIIEVEWEGNTKLHSLNTKPLSDSLSGWIAKYREHK